MVLVLYVVRMGRWSEFSAFSVVHVQLLMRVLVIVVMSGEVGCWSMCGGFLVGVSVFSVLCVEFCRRSAISRPLWSSAGEYHIVECAFTSAVMMADGSVVRYVSVFVMSLSSVA